MPENLRTSLHRPLQQLAFALSLLSSVSLAAAQTTAPPPRQVIPAPPPAAAYQAAPPARQGDYQAAPPPQQGEYQAAPPGAAPGQPQQAYPQQPQQQQQYYQTSPQGYPAAPPGAYPAQPYAGYQQPYVAPPGQPYIPPPARPRRGMMIAGASIFGGSYLLAMIVGSALIDNHTSNNDLDCRDCRTTGRLLFIPVVGPFIAMGSSHDGDVGLLLLGMVELVGAGLMTGGIIRYKNSKRALDAQGLSWDLGRERKLSLNVDASPRSAGPRMKIAF